MRRTAVRGVAAASSLLVGTLLLVVTPAVATAAPLTPTVGCSSSPSVFNTGVDGTGNGRLAAGSADRNWEMSQQYPRTSPAGLAPYPPANPVYTSAVVGNAAPGAWVASPYGNAEWIGGTHSTDGDWYYRYGFVLDPAVTPSTLSLSLNFYADNSVAQIWVNGAAQSSKTSGLPQTTGDPYSYGGYAAGRGATTVLNNDWTTGANAIVVLIKSGPGAQGFNVQARPSVLCPTPGVTVAQTVSPSVVSAAGQVITFSALVTNTGNVELSGVAVALAGFTGTGTAPAYTCPSATLPAGGSQTCTATYSVRAADLAQTSLAATATASGVGLGLTSRTAGAPDTDTVRVYRPAVVYDAASPRFVATPTPVISGTSDATPGSPVTVVVGGQTLTTTVGAGGAWSVTPTDLSDGPYTVRTSITDTTTGAVGAADQSLTVDTGVPTVTIDGGSAALTNDPTPTLSGSTSEAAGTSLTLTVGDIPYPVTVGDGGRWSITLDGPLTDGEFPVTAAVVDAAGNRGTAAQQLTVDLTPYTLTVTGGEIAYRNDTLTVSGTTNAPAGATITVDVDGTTYEAEVIVGGTWSVTVPDAADGTYEVTATVPDPAGNAAAARQTVVLDTVAPKLTIDGGTEVLTATATPTLTGTTDEPAGSTITVTVDGTPYPATVVDGGTWSLTPPELPDGVHHVTAAVTDAAGNTTTVAQQLTVDTTPPVLNLPAERAVRTPSPVITGTTDAPPGTTVIVRIGDQTFTGTVGPDGSWSVPLTTAADPPTETVWVDGTYTATVTVADPAGNQSTATQQLTVDTAAPAGSIAAPAAVGTRSAVLSGTTDLPAGSIITVMVGERLLTTTVSETGTWSVATGDLPDDTYPVTVSFVDAAGNKTTATDTLTVDTAAPTSPFTEGEALLVAESQPTLAGTAEPGSIISVSIDGKTYTADVASDGRWSITVDTLPDGVYPVAVTITDAVGNQRTVAISVTVDTTLPTMQLTGGTAITSTDATTTLGGVTDAPAGSTVTVQVGGYTLTAVVDADGRWSVAVPALTNGDYLVTTTISDTAGNTTVTTQTLTIAVLAENEDTPAGEPADDSWNDGPTYSDSAADYGSSEGHDTSPGLAYTGSDPTSTLAAASLLTLLGCALLLATRRRTRRQA